MQHYKCMAESSFLELFHYYLHVCRFSGFLQRLCPPLNPLLFEIIYSWELYLISKLNPYISLSNTTTVQLYEQLRSGWDADLLGVSPGS